MAVGGGTVWYVLEDGPARSLNKGSRSRMDDDFSPSATSSEEGTLALY